jgi:hypothetical protein
MRSRVVTQKCGTQHLGHPVCPPERPKISVRQPSGIGTGNPIVISYPDSLASETIIHSDAWGGSLKISNHQKEVRFPHFDFFFILLAKPKEWSLARKNAREAENTENIHTSGVKVS